MFQAIKADKAPTAPCAGSPRPRTGKEMHEADTGEDVDRSGAEPRNQKRPKIGHDYQSVT